MIDLGLTKLAIIGAVALVVIGPEKLPTVARTLGALYGRAQRYISQVKAEVSREMELDELRKMQQQVQQAAQEAGSSISGQLQEVQQEAQQELDALQHSWNETPDQPAYWTMAPSEDQIRSRVRQFKRKKLNRQAALPLWYKNRHSIKQHVTSGAARVARHRPRNPFKPHV
ncbi:Sec-independent protein translocase protein TatB [Massilia sp. W12]|uniref:Sec-independent protein translocase protein TatB n=1 Tax=Massilia sp. W12 TaxID=3126507 RepID=UPI0030D15987